MIDSLDFIIKAIIRIVNPYVPTSVCGSIFESTAVVPRKHSSRFPNNSEADASKLVENHE